MPVVENEVTATKEYKDEQQQQQQSLLKTSALHFSM